MRNLILIAIIFSFCFELTAQQENRHNRIGLSLANNMGYLKDSNFSTLNYRQSGQTFGLQYTKLKKNRFGVRLDFSISELNSDFSKVFKTTHLIGNLNLQYQLSMPIENDKLRWYVGPEYKFNFNLLDFRGFYAFSALIAHSLNVSSTAYYQMGERHRLKASFAIPIASIMVRPPYNGYDEAIAVNEDKPLKLVTNGKLISLNKYQAFDLGLEYDFQLLKWLDIKLGYALHYQRVNDIHKLVYAQNQIILGTTIKF